MTADNTTLAAGNEAKASTLADEAQQDPSSGSTVEKRDATEAVVAEHSDTPQPVSQKETPEPAAETKPRVVNDFSVQVGTVNGSGSQTANMVLMRALFDMGIPVSGKNLVPSNIQGLPTWFTIRVNRDGFVARKRELDICVAMNPQTAVEDCKSLRPGGVCISSKISGLDRVRTDVVHYQVPFAEIANQCTSDAKLRKLLVNMIYVGVVGHLLGIAEEVIESSIKRQLKDKPKAIPSNLSAVRKAREWAAANLEKKDDFAVERMDKTSGMIIIDGNTAAAIGAMFAGVTVATWYPITPSSSLCEALQELMGKYRLDRESGKATFAIVQAEDELAAAGMAVGAGWAGARSMTATSGPGISLMSEFVGLAYFAEIPLVLFDVNRTGPSTGLPTRTAQSDLSILQQLSHGDTEHVVLLPGSVEECYTLAMQAFDLAERLQTPVFVLSDFDLGMNSWMSPEFVYPDKPLDRGKVLTAADLDRLGTFERYRDVDGDGIAYRTLPGTKHALAAYFTRGTGHNEKSGYTERPEDYVRLMDRLSRKYDTARKLVPAPLVTSTDGARVGIIAFGSSHEAVLESQHQLEQETGLKTSYLRLRALPFTAEVRAFVEAHDRVYVVDQNRDAQLKNLIVLELPDLSGKLRSVRHYNGLPVDARSLTEAIAGEERS